MLLTVSDVATELGCGRDTVYALLADGTLPSVDSADDYAASVVATWKPPSRA